jgi:hypothetical protein
MQPSTLLLPAAFATNCRPLPLSPPLPLPPGHRCLHRHHRGQTHRRPLPKKGNSSSTIQHTNGSTNVKMFTSPDNLDLFNLSIVFEVCDDGRGNLAISKLFAEKNCTFLQSTYSEMTRSTILGGGAPNILRNRYRVRERKLHQWRSPDRLVAG